MTNPPQYPTAHGLLDGKRVLVTASATPPDYRTASGLRGDVVSDDRAERAATERALTGLGVALVILASSPLVASTILRLLAPLVRLV